MIGAASQALADVQQSTARFSRAQIGSSFGEHCKALSRFPRQIVPPPSLLPLHLECHTFSHPRSTTFYTSTAKDVRRHKPLGRHRRHWRGP